MALKLYDKLKHSIRYWLLRTLPTCQQTVEKISQSMERSLSLEERIKLKLHREGIEDFEVDLTAQYIQADAEECGLPTSGQPT